MPQKALELDNKALAIMQGKEIERKYVDRQSQARWGVLRLKVAWDVIGPPFAMKGHPVGTWYTRWPVHACWLHTAAFLWRLVKWRQTLDRFLLSMMLLPRCLKVASSHRIESDAKYLEPENLVQVNEGSLRRIDNVGGVQFRWNWLVGTSSQ